MDWASILFFLGYAAFIVIGAVAWTHDSAGWALIWWFFGFGGIWHFFLKNPFERYRYNRELEREAERSRIQRMEDCSQAATKILRSISGHLPEASQHLDAAERELAQRAFTPFWVEVETASAEIGRFADDIDRVTQLVDSYRTDAERCVSSSPPPFRAPLEMLPKHDAAKPVIERLDRLVRQTHKDFQFTTIYEQRRTTRTVELGLRDLHQAISEMSDSISRSFQRLDASIVGLGHSVAAGFGALTDTLEAQSRNQQRELSRIRRKL